MAEHLIGRARVELCQRLEPAGFAVLRNLGPGPTGWPTEDPPNVEETALAVDALASWAAIERAPELADAARRGAARLVELTEQCTRFPAAPIGLYFAKLWYYERLYPLIFTVSALGRVCGLQE